MGLFDKIFKKNDSIKVNPPSHKEQWDFYFSNVNDKPSSITVDLGLHSIAPIADKQNVVWVSIKMNNPRKEDGLSSAEEMPILGNIEDSLVEHVTKNHNAIFVGRLTSDGHRDFYFYFGDTTLYDKTISATMVAYPKYHFDFGTKADKEWDGYFNFLYPLPEQFQTIQNRNVVESLEESGDKHEKPREVDHWIYFKTEKDREAFVDKVKADKFNITEKSYDKENGQLPFKLRISRVDKVDLESVNDYFIHLWRLAQECNGDYDGWETSIEK